MEEVIDEEFDTEGSLISATPRQAPAPLREADRHAVAQAIKHYMDICEAALDPATSGPAPTNTQSWHALYAICQYVAWDAKHVES